MSNDRSIEDYSSIRTDQFEGMKARNGYPKSVTTPIIEPGHYRNVGDWNTFYCAAGGGFCPFRAVEIEMYGVKFS